jgi:molecular chaperone IbpA
MTRYRVDIFNQLDPFFLGFESMFDRFDHFFGAKQGSYPPHNVVEVGANKFDIEIALAGFKKSDIDISVFEHNLTIKHVKTEKTEDDGVRYRGIAKREFTKIFTLSDAINVIGAELEDGLLKIHLEKIDPTKTAAVKINIK